MSFDAPKEVECPCCAETIPWDTYPCPECGAGLDEMFWATYANQREVERDEALDRIATLEAELAAEKARWGELRAWLDSKFSMGPIPNAADVIRRMDRLSTPADVGTNCLNSNERAYWEKR